MSEDTLELARELRSLLLEAATEALESSELAGKGPNDPLFATTADRMNLYLDVKAGAEFKIKDLRTYHANAVAREEIAKVSVPPATRAEFVKARKAVAVTVSQHLGNTPKMALDAYINPAAFDVWTKDPSWLT
jgi:DNA topoisomerase IB